MGFNSGFKGLNVDHGFKGGEFFKNAPKLILAIPTRIILHCQELLTCSL